MEHCLHTKRSLYIGYRPTLERTAATLGRRYRGDNNHFKSFPEGEILLQILPLPANRKQDGSEREKD